MSKVVWNGDEDECWTWAGAKLPRGYGQFPTKDAGRYAHRFAYHHFVGPIPNGLLVLHKCDNPSCVNPAHLTIGTQAQNLRECLARGRAARKGGEVLGERHHNARHSDAEVEEMRRRVASGETQRSVAQAFDISPSAVCMIVKGKRRSAAIPAE